MLVTRREGFSAVPITPGTARSAGARRVRGEVEASFDQITLRAGQETSPTFRAMAASLSRQVRTYNTTGKVQALRAQVASGTYRPDARETAARMLLMAEGE